MEVRGDQNEGGAELTGSRGGGGRAGEEEREEGRKEGGEEEVKLRRGRE